MWFASRCSANESEFTNQTSQSFDIKLTGESSKGDLIDTQDILIYQTKKQCALVEVKSTAKGTQTFDLPQHLKRSTSANRARKDNYTTLMLSNWALKCFFDIKSHKNESSATFTPIMLD